ncbi:RNA-binding (RRM/RBD/RNP motifs) family protein [Actinidia rufa]|uniref:RNA-binding (RRM/RBD/RNP motifs) family protein n=1 Tax=Actinidia rufa TaxID=165716 RepID=A0A7J0GG58_9ERIC|nr:RNA-binding (RRM/RBD/RNP motifs) family protein [Actinidia rufa]
MATAPPSQSSLNPQTAPFIGYQGAAKVSSETSEEWAETLLIRHLPEAIPHDALSRLFSHYGASSVRPCANGRVRNCAFVDFKSEALATQAHRQLNGAADSSQYIVLLEFLMVSLSPDKKGTMRKHILDSQSLHAPSDSVAKLFERLLVHEFKHSDIRLFQASNRRSREPDERRSNKIEGFAFTSDRDVETLM